VTVDATSLLQKSLEFETLLADVSARLLAATPDDVEAVVQAALERVRVFFAADRCGLLSVNADRTASFVRFAALADGLELPPSDANLVELFPWIAQKLLVEGEPAELQNTDDLPPEAARDRASFQLLSTRANLTVPILLPNGTLHPIVLHWVKSRPPDLAAQLARLRLFGGMVVNALERRDAFRALRTREAQLERAATAGGCGLWDLDTVTGQVWATNEARRLYGFAPDEPATWPQVQAKVHPEDRDFVLRRLDEVMAGQGVFDERYRIVRPDGAVRWLHVTGVRTAPGHLEGASVDVTRIVEAERRAQAALEEVRRLQDRLEQENVYLRSEATRRSGPELIVGRSQAIRDALTLADQVAPTDSTVLLLGETGSGKERFATYIHDASRRRHRTMIRVNCASIPVALMESELFGREKGAFTGSASRQLGRFELAHGSTLFLDEVGDLPTEVQVKLLRVLEEGTIERLGSGRPIKVDVRIIAATHRDLRRLVAERTFREDLYYRLNVFPLPLPPLRARREDIPSLVWALVEELATTIGKRIRGVDPQSMAALARHPWPGNVRELRNVIERAMILATSPVLRIDESLLDSQPAARPSGDVMGRQEVLQVLQDTGWRIRGSGGAAARLGLKPTTLEARMKRLGITRPGVLTALGWLHVATGAVASAL
jgi:DNA-binding NtrC family response regulator